MKPASTFIGNAIASLPMYDVPELRAETDALWAAIRDAIRARGIEAPDALTRGPDETALWRDSALVLSQTCGMPWRLGLHTDATLIGTPDYDVEGCPPGYYRSAVITRADDSDPKIWAYNATTSQSGYAAIADSGVVLKDSIETGSHGASIAAVASGKADIASIDAVTWRLAQRFTPDATALKVIRWTPPTPGLPYITAKHRDPAPLAEAVTEAIAALPPRTRDALGLTGFVHIPSADYLALN